MTPRAVRRERRELAILGALAGFEHCTMTVEVVAITVHRAPRRVFPDLERLMYHHRIVRVTGGSLTEQTQVRLATSAERGLIVPRQRAQETR